MDSIEVQSKFPELPHLGAGDVIESRFFKMAPISEAAQNRLGLEHQTCAWLQSDSRCELDCESDDEEEFFDLIS